MDHAVHEWTGLFIYWITGRISVPYPEPLSEIPLPTGVPRSLQRHGSAPELSGYRGLRGRCEELSVHRFDAVMHFAALAYVGELVTARAGEVEKLWRLANTTRYPRDPRSSAE
jgi:hypothetical protein